MKWETTISFSGYDWTCAHRGHIAHLCAIAVREVFGLGSKHIPIYTKLQITLSTESMRNGHAFYMGRYNDNGDGEIMLSWQKGPLPSVLPAHPLNLSGAMYASAQRWVESVLTLDSLPLNRINEFWIKGRLTPP